MRHHPLLFNLGGWPPARGLDPSLVRHLAGLPLGAVTVRPISQCFGHLNPTTLLWRILAGFSDDQPATRDPTTLVCRHHNVSARGTTKATKNVSTILNIFLDFSSLYLNQDKSTLVTSGMPEEEAAQCSAIRATPLESLPIR